MAFMAAFKNYRLDCSAEHSYQKGRSVFMGTNLTIWSKKGRRALMGVKMTLQANRAVGYLWGGQKWKNLLKLLLIQASIVLLHFIFC